MDLQNNKNNQKINDTIWIDSKQLREELTNLAISEYNNPQTNENMQSAQEPAAVGSNIKDANQEDAPKKEETSSPAFSDDDIPF